jgi:hypothetical protein
MTIGDKTVRGLRDAAMHLRLAAVGKKTLADHLSRVHGVEGATPLMSWTKDELESDHEEAHRREAR